MKEILFKGVGTAIATPFTDRGINFEEFGKLLEFQIEKGVNAIIVCGTTGESATMSLDEKKELLNFTVDRVQRRIPIIAGTGSNCTSSAIELSQYAESIGIDGLLIVTPYYNKTTQNGLISHYSKIAESVSLPIILYNVPSRTGVNISPETCFELSKISNIVAIKEASGDISQVAKIAHLCGDNLNIYSGNDDQILPVLSIGGIGVISVLSNIAPKYTCEMVESFFEGNYYISKRMQLKALPLIKSLFSEVNPIPVKHALNLKGYNFGIPRLPLVTLNKEHSEILEREMKEFGLI